MDTDRTDPEIDSGPTIMYAVQTVEVGDTADVLLHPDCEYCYLYRCDECHAACEKRNKRLSAMRRQGRGGGR